MTYITHVKPADNGMWYVECEEHGLIDSGITIGLAQGIADQHMMTVHDGE